MRDRGLTRSRILALVAAIALLAACEEPTAVTPATGDQSAAAPQITELVAKDAGADVVSLFVRATDPSGSAVSVRWAVTKGELSSSTSPSVLWRLPKEAGTYQASVEVTNAQGLKRVATQQVQVSADGKAAVDGEAVVEGPGGGGVPQSGTGRFQVPSPLPFGTPTPLVVGGNPAAPAGPTPTPAQPFEQPAATPVPGSTPAGPPGSQPIATPTPTPPPATPTPTPTPTPRPPTPEPGVPQPPPSRWLTVSSQAVPTGSALHSVHFIPGADGAFSQGWAAGDAGAVIATTDGGQTWTLKNAGLAATEEFVDVFFTSPTNGFIAAASGKVFRTLDGGTTWQDISPPDAAFQLSNMVVYNAQIVVLARTDGRVLRSENANAATAAGVSWNVMESKPPDRPSDQVSLIQAGAAFPTAAESSLGWFVGDGIYRLDSDGNPQWKKMVGVGTESATAVTLASQNEIWAGTGSGTLFKSVDGGNTWTTLTSLFNREHNGNDQFFRLTSVQDLAFVDGATGWALANNNQVYDTLNAGASWKRTDLPGFLRDIQIESRIGAGGAREFFGWGVGSGGLVVRYVPN